MIGIWLAWGCSDSRMEDGSGTSDEEIYLTLSLNLPGGQSSSTRSGQGTQDYYFTAAQESAVNSLQVLVFKEEGEAVGEAALFAYNAPVLKMENGTVTVLLRKSTQGEKYSLMLFANAGKPTRTLTTADTKSVARTLFTFQECYYGGNYDKVYFYKGGLPMSGESTMPQVVTTDAETSFGVISLKRAAARIDVGVNFTSTVNDAESASGLANFALTEIFVFNANHKGYVADIGIPTDAKKERPMYAEDCIQQGSSCVRLIYLPEAKNTTDATGATPLPDDQRCCLVLGGRFDANGNGTTADDAVSYYRVDLVDAKGKQMDLVRNNRYVVNVTKVSRAGFPTANDAFLAGPMNITVSINAWNESSHDMVYDGQHYFQTETRVVTLPHGQGQSRTIAVSTDVPVAKWKFISPEAWGERMKVECTQNAIKFTAIWHTIPSPTEVRLQVENLVVTFDVKSQTSLTPGSIQLNDWATPVFSSILASPANGIVSGTVPGDEDWMAGGTLDGGNLGVETFLGGDNPEQTANCYLALPGRMYRINGTWEGNGNGNRTQVGSTVGGVGIRNHARVVWQSARGLINDVRYAPNTGYIHFRTGSAARTRFWNSSTEEVQATGGNAVVAVAAADGTILWSWHIWVVADAATRRTILAGTGDGNRYMDRNLGALGNKEADKALAYGMFYQWGRKDPFPSSPLYEGAAFSTLYDGLGNVVEMQASVSDPTLSYAAKNPLTLMTHESSDWLSNNNIDLWGSPTSNDATTSWKTRYDPCPAGWKVPPVYTLTGSGAYANNGMVVFPTQGNVFPLVGYGAVGVWESANRGYYWTSSVRDRTSAGVTIDKSGSVSSIYPYPRNRAFSVRCIKE